ncbi:ABC-2 type transporter [Thermaerobacter marianensis DSM 12885]|uniref:Transport permease protein n=1 Tax=Thermaerobacter marianensis (strain ATCC 700841 / DSM 12885 / JCM 10246 / 7p75a) TaxID=644966 RepID=E6SI61_THEM7|nr:ABC transporter permease [Thermaerobacter marianensis]ADU50839.1 ABC-2 type transporter [Thermaerobacter marianensis DSM 12885]
MGRRIGSVMAKEFIHLRRDHRTLAMIIVIPLVWLLLFGYAFSFDVSDLRVAVVDRSGTEAGRILAGALRDYKKFRPVALPLPEGASLTEIDRHARQQIRQDALDMAVILPPGFGEPGSTARMQALLDGSQLFSAQAGARLLQDAMEEVQDELQAAIQDAVQAEVEQDVRSRLEENLRAQWEERLAPLRQRLAAMGLPTDTLQAPDVDALDVAPADLPEPPNLAPDVEILYNPDLKSAPVMIPGLLGMVTMLATTLLVALGIVREREYGTLEQLAVTPLRPFELVVGKLLPYIVLAGVDFVLVLVAGITLFGLEPAGSLALFTGLTLLFLLSTVGLGVLVSTVSENQQQAMQLAFFVMFPQILISGLIFPVSSMPRVIQWISMVLPFTYFVPIARGIFLKGQGLDVLWPNALALAFFGVALVTLASVRLRRRLTAA